MSNTIGRDAIREIIEDAGFEIKSLNKYGAEYRAYFFTPSAGLTVYLVDLQHSNTPISLVSDHSLGKYLLIIEGDEPELPHRVQFGGENYAEAVVAFSNHLWDYFHREQVPEPESTEGRKVTTERHQVEPLSSYKRILRDEPLS